MKKNLTILIALFILLNSTAVYAVDLQQGAREVAGGYEGIGCVTATSNISTARSVATLRARAEVLQLLGTGYTIVSTSAPRIEISEDGATLCAVVNVPSTSIIETPAPEAPAPEAPAPEVPAPEAPAPEAPAPEAPAPEVPAPEEPEPEVPAPEAPAPEVPAPEEPEPEVRPFRNLANYFATFVDIDSNIRYLTDDLLITNQCKKRDIFAIHSRNDQISNQLIQNYTTLTDQDLEALKLEYATLNLELKFLRKINLLAGQNGSEELKSYLIDKAKNDYKQLAEDQFPVFLAKYQDSLTEYQNCRNSWIQVAEKVNNIKNNATQISNDSDTLLNTLASLKQTVIETPRGFYENSLQEGLRDGIVNSATASWTNLRTEARRINEELERTVMNPENATFEILRTIDGRRRYSVNEILENESNLLSIVQTVRNQEVVGDLKEELQLLQAELTISNNFSDSANVSLLSSLLYANYAVSEATRTFESTETGINDQAREIYRMQCR